MRWLYTGMVPLLAGCVGSGEIPTRVTGQIVGIDFEPLGPGLVLVEEGEVHNGAYVLGAPIDKQGRFSVELDQGGEWGLHIFRDGYQYLPLSFEVEDNQQVVLTSLDVVWGDWLDLTGLPVWPTQPTDSTQIRMPFDDRVEDNPRIDDVRMTYVGERLRIEVDVADPDDDLSKMVLVYDEVTGAGYNLNPPEATSPDQPYPTGTWTLEVYLDEAHEPGRSVWQFVVSDDMCNDTDILFVEMPTR